MREPVGNTYKERKKQLKNVKCKTNIYKERVSKQKYFRHLVFDHKARSEGVDPKAPPRRLLEGLADDPLAVHDDKVPLRQHERPTRRLCDVRPKLCRAAGGGGRGEGRGKLSVGCLLAEVQAPGLKPPKEVLLRSLLSTPGFLPVFSGSEATGGGQRFRVY